MSNPHLKTKSKAKAMTSAPARVRRSRLFGPPPLLAGEDAAAYADLFDGIHAAVKPVDTVDEMLIADVVLEEWEVLRGRRLKFSVIRVHQLEVLEKFLGKTLDYKLYAEDFAEDLAETLEDNLPTDQADIAQQLAQACARNDSVAVDKVNKALARIHWTWTTSWTVRRSARRKSLRKSTFGVNRTLSRWWTRLPPTPAFTSMTSWLRNWPKNSTIYRRNSSLREI